ncbi:MAG: hypothetical protein BAJALOKI3v1_890016 [Promethearchaeota archaeon]|nr:MAG: hypothetical protein BAJALOKI3v1_890016 [Candidatus Lokiarchaeota archaeon]
MPRRKQKLKYSRKNACKHLEPVGNVSSSLQPLAHCKERDLVLGTKAYVCQVCDLYSQSNDKISEIYQESKTKAEKLIKEQEAEKLEVATMEEEEEIDLSVDEFEEEEEIPERFEKRKTGKTIDETEDFAVECPFCGEMFDNLATHVAECEFAPEDVDLDDYIPTRTRKSKKKKEKEEEKDTIPCPYCGKEYIRLSRHLPYCDDRPEEANEEKEELYMEGEIDLEEFNEE